MAVSPEDVLFALAGALVLASLAAGMARRGAGLGRAEADFMGALYLTAVALLAAVVASVREWDASSDVLVVATAGGALGSVCGAALQSAGVRFRSVFGERGLRWAVATASVGLSCFGWGAAAVGGAAPGTGAPAGWVSAAVGAAAALALLTAAMASGKTRAKLQVRVQLLGGAAALAAGLVAVSTGPVAVGSAVTMVGGGFLYSAARGPKRAAEGEAREERQEPPGDRRQPVRARADPGVKVRVPKGTANRVTRFRDDGLPPGGST